MTIKNFTAFSISVLDVLWFLGHKMHFSILDLLLLTVGIWDPE